MIELPWADLPDARISGTPAAITIGVFDGVHRGHQCLTAAVASQPGLLPVVITFDRHPTETVAPGRFPGLVTSKAQQNAALADAGIEAVIRIEFSAGFSRIPGTSFLDRVLELLSVGEAVIGHDFRCGHEMSMEAPEVVSHLKERGIGVTVPSPVTESGWVISSSRIRQCIRDGEIRHATELMGRPVSLDLTGESPGTSSVGVSVRLDEQGLVPGSRQVTPASGKYAVDVLTTNERIPTEMSVIENSLRLPLAVTSSIRYIELQDKRD